MKKRYMLDDPNWFGKIDRPAAVLLKVPSSGRVAGRDLKKIAAAAEIAVINIKPKPNHVYPHIIAATAGEFFGPNTRADFLNERPMHLINQEKEVYLEGCLPKYLPTFKKGGVYREHITTIHGAKPSGKIIWVGYNQPMHRAELILELPVDAWQDVVELIDAGEPVGWSVGYDVPYDTCSICLNQRKTYYDICDHLLYGPLTIDESGQVVYAINDKPMFDDISYVKKPADVAARILMKVASEKNLKNLVDIGVVNTNTNNYIKNTNMAIVLRKLAMLEKEIPARVSELGDLRPVLESWILSPTEEKIIVDTLRKYFNKIDHVIGFSISNRIPIPPYILLKVIHPEAGQVGCAPSFETLLNEPSFLGLVNQIAATHHLQIPILKPNVKKVLINILAPIRPVRFARIIKISSEPVKIIDLYPKLIRKQANDKSIGIAVYQTAYLMEHPEDSIHIAVQNYIDRYITVKSK